MKIFIADDYEQLSKMAADDLIELTAGKKEPVVCTASGDSPAGMYRELVQKVNNGQADVSNWKFLGLDEWTGLNGADEGSCRFHLNNQLFNPLNVPNEQIIFMDGRAADLQSECDSIEALITQQQGIDVAIVGLGMNGHIGMNEPGTSATSRTHISQLDAITQQVGQKYFTSQQALTSGITLGLGTLMKAKTVVLLVSGSHKAAIVKQVLEGDISEQVPASLFRNHPDFRVYLDKAAAQFINP